MSPGYQFVWETQVCCCCGALQQLVSIVLKVPW